MRVTPKKMTRCTPKKNATYAFFCNQAMLSSGVVVWGMGVEFVFWARYVVCMGLGGDVCVRMYLRHKGSWKRDVGEVLSQPFRLYTSQNLEYECRFKIHCCFMSCRVPRLAVGRL